ncbi:MAG: 50S ribosomal protein L22 [Clostridia bacterium]|jgi:large subunit ribosomal protein L22|nr:50S ribosomal protein L22 [Clostridia bacterium]MDH7571934.1 50S ribosomal protein L22 [Clostridia bacterium]
MEVRATARYVRLSPKKAQGVVSLIRGKGVDEAMAILRFTPQKAGRIIAKVLQSAVANAEHNHDLDRDRLYVARAYVDQGPSLKRYMPRAFGRANLMRHRTSHVTVVVAHKEG